MITEHYYLVFGLNTLLYVIDNDVIVYNIESQKSIEVINNQKIADLLSRKVCLLNEGDLCDLEIRGLVNNIVDTNLGQLVNSKLYNELPINILPYQPIDTVRNSQNFKINDIIKDYDFFRSKDIKLTLYINDRCKLNCSNCSSASKQFLWCTSLGNESEIGLLEIKKVMVDPEIGKNRYPISISGGNIFLHSNLDEIVFFLNARKNIKIYQVYYRNINSKTDFTIFNSESSLFEITVSEKVQFDHLEFVKRRFNESGLNYKFSFIISKAEDVDNIETIAEKLHIKNYKLRPFYTGYNLHFFKEFLFFDRHDIVSQKNNLTRIFRNRLWNHNYNNNIILKSNGKIFSNFDSKVLGDIRKENWADIKIKAIRKKSNFSVRNMIKPCNKCIYSLLCPALGNYELAIDKPNLCTIKTQFT